MVMIDSSYPRCWYTNAELMTSFSFVLCPVKELADREITTLTATFDQFGRTNRDPGKGAELVWGRRGSGYKVQGVGVRGRGIGDMTSNKNVSKRISWSNQSIHLHVMLVPIIEGGSLSPCC
jgi:hypothetical protein